jgi:hypothetical protein
MSLDGEDLTRTPYSERHLPGERGWVKIKNRSYWRYQLERESAINKRRVKQFV